MSHFEEHLPRGAAESERTDLAEHADKPAEAALERPRRRLLIPLLLFVATCFTTYRTGEAEFPNAGWMYAGAILTILLCHEFGHFLQAVRYRVPASLPWFIPMPIGPFGTMGAVIGMRGGMGNRRSLFDIGITGPLAGIVPALIFSVLGIKWSTIIPKAAAPQVFVDSPPLFNFIISQLVEPLQVNTVLNLHPVAYAGWVGIFITSLNLIPIGQLDGGHVLYALLREKSYPVTTLLLAGAIAAVLWSGLYEWMLMLFLLWLIGPNHPPTADDNVPLGPGRTLLGWLTLLFPIIGFTPTPFVML